MTFGITLRGCVSAERLACCIERERERDYCTERIGVDFFSSKTKEFHPFARFHRIFDRLCLVDAAPAAAPADRT